MPGGVKQSRRSFLKLVAVAAPAVAALPAIAALPAPNFPRPVACKLPTPPAPYIAPAARLAPYTWPRGIVTRLPGHFGGFAAPCFICMHVRPWQPWRRFVFRFHGIRDRDVGQVEIVLDGMTRIWQCDLLSARAIAKYRGLLVSRGYLIADFEGSSINHELLADLSVLVNLNGNAREPRIDWYGIT